MDKVYDTPDAFPAGFLLTKGFTPKITERDNLLLFTFPETPELLAALAEYNSGAQVDALRFAAAVKMIKGQLYAMRRRSR